MSVWQRIASFWHARRLEQDLDDELAFHLAEKQKRLMESGGVTAAQAANEAHRQFGNTTRWREETRGLWRFAWLDGIVADLRYAIRGLRQQRGFTIAASVTLALGIGANAAVFSLFNALLLRPLGVPQPDRIAQLYISHLPSWFRQWENGNALTTGERRFLSYPMYEAVAARTDLFTGVYVIAGQGAFTIDVNGVNTQISGQLVSGNFFSVLGLTPIAGRVFQAEDDRSGAGASGWPVLISASLAFRQFGSPQAAVGQRLLVERVPSLIIGVLPAGFLGINPGERRDLWLPNEMAFAMWGGKWKSQDRSMNYAVGARLRDGVDWGQADRQLQTSSPTVLETAAPSDLRTEERVGYMAMQIRARRGDRGDSALRREFGGALGILLATVQLVLLIACSNVANLMLARGLARRKEMAMRLALGASRWRLFRQLLTESAVLASLAAVLGILLARWISSGILALALSKSAESPLQFDAVLDARVLLFLCSITMATVLLLGVFPAYAASGTNPQEALKQNAGLSSAPGLVRRGLVVLQVALTMMLIAGAGLFVSTLRSLLNEDSQVNRAQVAVVRADLIGAGVMPAQMPELYDWLKHEVDRLPQVQSSAWAEIVPFGGSIFARTVIVPQRPDLTNEQRFVHWNDVGLNYFETLHLPLLAGRTFNEQDLHDHTPRLLLSERTAREWFGDSGAVGRHIGIDEKTQAEVIGVVADAKYQSLRGERSRTVYALYTQKPKVGTGMHLLVRSSGSPMAIPAAIRTLLQQRLGRTPRLEASTLAETAVNSVRREWLIAWLLSAFAAIAMLIAAVGLYGLVRYVVAGRRKELAIRLCLGAPAGQIVSGLLRESALLVALGALLGGLAARLLAPLVKAQLYGVQPGDPRVMATALLLLATAGLLAAAGPAWRACRLDPMQILREE